MCLTYYFLFYLAPQRGIEPRTNWLTANYSTAELLGNVLWRCDSDSNREPGLRRATDQQSALIPLQDRTFEILILTLVEDSGIEPLTVTCKATVFPIIPIPRILGDQGGNRTPTSGFGDHRTAIILPSHVSNTLLPVCVSKHTNKVSSVFIWRGSVLRYSGILPTALSPQSSHPPGRPHYSSVQCVCRVAFPMPHNEKPRSVQFRGSCQIYEYSLIRTPALLEYCSQSHWPTASLLTGGTGALALNRIVVSSQFLLQCIYHCRSTCNKNQCGIYATQRIWLQRVDSNHRPLGYEPSQIPLLILCVMFIYTGTH